MSENKECDERMFDDDDNRSSENKAVKFFPSIFQQNSSKIHINNLLQIDFLSLFAQTILFFG